jgi:hypothetical protein
MAKFYAVALGTAQLWQTVIRIEDYGGDFAAVAYDSLPANQPKSYKNTVYVWDATSIPWGSPPPPPPYQKRIGSNAQNGKTVMTDLTISANSYIFGYAVGDNPSLICASVILDAGGLVTSVMSVSIGVRFIGTDSVTVRYQVLPGYLPQEYGNWVGLWKGTVSPYLCPKPEGTTSVPNVTEGTVTIEDVAIAIDTPYTLVYFMGEPENLQKNTTAAAILTFRSTEAGSLAARTLITPPGPMKGQ